MGFIWLILLVVHQIVRRHARNFWHVKKWTLRCCLYKSVLHPVQHKKRSMRVGTMKSSRAYDDLRAALSIKNATTSQTVFATTKTSTFGRDTNAAPFSMSRVQPAFTIGKNSSSFTPLIETLLSTIVQPLARWLRHQMLYRPGPNHALERTERCGISAGLIPRQDF